MNEQVRSMLRMLSVGAAVLSFASLCASAAHAQTSVPYPRIETGTHTAAIRRIAVDRAERWLVTASDDKTARVWNLKTGALERILRPPIGEKNEGRLYAMAISPDGRRVAVGGFTGRDGSVDFPIYLFDRASGRLLERSRGYASPASHLAFSADGTRLAAAFVGGVGLRVLDANALTRELARDEDCTGNSYGVDFDPAGRLVASCFDGQMRLYDAGGQRIAKRAVEGGALPFGVRFSPDGARVAVGFNDSSAVTVLSGRDLSLLYRVDTPFATNGNLMRVTWSHDGERLYAGGRLYRESQFPIVSWPAQGRGAPLLHDAAVNTIMDLAPLSGGRLAFGSGDAAWGVLGADGRLERQVRPALLDYRGNRAGFRVSGDGQRLEFSFGKWNDAGTKWLGVWARFDLRTRRLETAVEPEAGLAPPRTDGLPVKDWENNFAPTFNAQRLATLDPYERSRALAVAADASGFTLGTEWSVRHFDAGGEQRWVQSVPGTAWAVNQSADGRFVLAALGDGTIRWYDAATGNERLALFIHAQDQRWVLFTPEGFYQASPGGDALLGYQLNRGPDHEGEFVDSAQLAGVFFRPDLITARLAGDETAIARAVQSIGDVREVLAGGLPPKVEFLSLRPLSSGNGNEYELKVRVTPASAQAGVGDLKLFINGIPVSGRGGESPLGGGVVTQHVALAPGMQTVGLGAARRDGKVYSDLVAAPPVQVQALGPAQPVLRVLAVGISTYDDASFSTGVKFAARDAEALTQRLRAGATGLYREVDAMLLTGREKTDLKTIDAAIQSLVKRARPEDVVVIFLAGHGKAPDGQYHFIPADFIYDGPQAFKGDRTLSHARLEAMLKGLGAGKRLLILDTCASGATIEGRDGSTEQKDALSILMRSTGRHILAAASPQGKALELGMQQHGVYTFALLEGMAGAADPGKAEIEVDALASYLSRRVPELTRQLAGYAQQPMRSAYRDSFPLVRRVKGE